MILISCFGGIVWGKKPYRNGFKRKWDRDVGNSNIDSYLRHFVANGVKK